MEASMKKIRGILIFSSLGIILGLAYVVFIMATETGFDWPVLIIILLSCIFAVGMMSPIYRMFFQREIKDGVSGEATLLKFADSGTTINDNPLVNLLLEIQLPGQPSLKVETKTVVNRLSAPNLREGMIAEITYSAKNPKRFVVNSFKAIDQPTSTGERIVQLDELKSRGLVTEDEYQQKRDEILKAL